MRYIVMSVMAAMVGFAPVQAADKAMGIVTGSETGTYHRIGQDIAAVASATGLSVDVKSSNGSIDNIQRISSSENAALGIVQSDLLGFLKRSDDPRFVAYGKKLRMLFPFYQEEVHVLARKDITSLADLKGRRVVVGPEGSGHWLTAMNMFSIVGVRPAQYVRTEPTKGLMDVLQGRADAMVFVGGKPVRLFMNMSQLAQIPRAEYAGLLDNVHLVPISDKRLLNEYSQTTINAADYGFVAQDVPTVAVKAVLVSYDFSDMGNSYRKERCEAIGQLGLAMRRHLPDLQERGHPKWKEVSLSNGDVGMWKQDTCVGRVATAELKGASALENALLKTIESDASAQ